MKTQSMAAADRKANRPTFISRYQGISGSLLQKSPRSGAPIPNDNNSKAPWPDGGGLGRIGSGTQQKRRISIFFETDDESYEANDFLSQTGDSRFRPSVSTFLVENDPPTNPTGAAEPKIGPMVRWISPLVDDSKKDALGHTDSFKNRNEIELSEPVSLPRVRSQPVNEDSKPISLQRQTSYQEVDTRSRRRNSFVPISLPVSNPNSNPDFDLRYCKRERLRNSFPKTPTFDSVKETTVDSTQEDGSDSEKDNIQQIN